MKNPPEHSDEAGARALAQRIREHWAKRGYVVKTKLVPWLGLVNSQHNSQFWCVRSDMVNGMPVQKIAMVAA